MADVLSQTTPAMPLTGGTDAARQKAGAFFAQPAIRKALPAIAGIGALAVVAAMWMTLATGPSRVLYTSLSDGERASVVETLETGGIDYDIDNATGMLSVAEDDLYRARMLVASEGGLAAPETGSEMLNNIPLGASRTLEGERLRQVRERELMLTIGEIDGVEAVRVHLATPQRSAFVRENTAPSASVMVRLSRGHSLTPPQVSAIVNLVAGSVPGMTADAVKLVDQHGRLISATADAGTDRLKMQADHEEKLRLQIASLLVPMLGEGNFSTEVQVDLDMSEQTSARETYDKEGVIRSETEMRSSRADAAAAAGIPGVTANTPPPAGELVDGAPEGTDAAGAAGTTDSDSTARRTYELGREVAVSSNGPGTVRRLSVAVALSKEAMAQIAPVTPKQIETLVASAVGADDQRGDKVTVVTGKFDPLVVTEPPFYETSWFAAILRNAVALIAVILALWFGVRPMVRALKRDDTAEQGDVAAPVDGPVDGGELQASNPAPPGATRDNDALREQVALARSLATQQPDRAATALRRMLAEPAA
ncbi:Flagellar M-ring protein [Alteripontixanthobacter maritimus]|uniref:Flagellar M-ring protein n=1 Tax=Alteripontixanthobacter maritimus TaxID=2161824 RepID=A0A369Q892_9SPHN|nr:flagellar basal-body MS-ring/collar protein FliF [Alteripontixanthobacter maritimus]RDC59139.1 Flagellar M-ring protein [Alteripontixanthobacter maritimus]